MNAAHIYNIYAREEALQEPSRGLYIEEGKKLIR